MIKQPELGKKITELRKAKGLTQEELVARCNVSVRTIQRIETGEVTPRSYTVRIILSALEYDLSQVADEQRVLSEEDVKENASPRSNPFMSFDVSKNGSNSFVVKQLTLAWIFGLVYFLLSFAEALAEYFRFSSDDLLFSEPFYIGLKVVLMVSVFFFYRGFIFIGSIFDNYLLKIVSVILIGLNLILMTYDIGSLFYDSIERDAAMIMAAIAFGITGVIYAFSLWRLHLSLGPIAQLAAGFEALSGCLFLTVALALVGDVVHVPAELFQFIMLFKAVELMRKKQQKPTLNGELQTSI
jgi:transcriptional regulator with XRE-family HTH domain